MTFAEELRPLVEAVGGAVEAARILEVNHVSVYRWLRGYEPNKPTQWGAKILLSEARWK